MPRLSVVIPVYNPGKYFKLCLETVLVDNADIEYVIVDDGSTEDLSPLYKKLGQKKNVIVKRTENHGVSEARNAGIRLSSGDYIMFVDADDYLLDDWEKAINSVDKELDFIKFSGKINDESIHYDNRKMTKACLGLSGTILDSCGFANVFSGFYKRDFLVKNNISFDKDLKNGEDLIFNLKVLQNAKKVKIIPNGFYYYRHNIKSSSHTFGEKIIVSDQLFREKLSSILGDKYRDEMLLSNANGLYVVVNSLICAKSANVKRLIKDAIETHDVVAELNAVSNTRLMNRFRKVVIKNLLKQHIPFSIFLLKAKRAIQMVVPTSDGEVI